MAASRGRSRPWRMLFAPHGQDLAFLGCRSSHGSSFGAKAVRLFRAADAPERIGARVVVRPLGVPRVKNLLQDPGGRPYNPSYSMSISPGTRLGAYEILAL